MAEPRATEPFWGLVRTLTSVEVKRSPMTAEMAMEVVRAVLVRWRLILTMPGLHDLRFDSAELTSPIGFW